MRRSEASPEVDEFSDRIRRIYRTVPCSALRYSQVLRIGSVKVEWTLCTFGDGLVTTVSFEGIALYQEESGSYWLATGWPIHVQGALETLRRHMVLDDLALLGADSAT